MRKGAEAESVLHNIDLKVDFLNQHVLPPGVKIVPHIDRDDLVHLTTHTVLHNLTEGILLVVIVLFFFLGNIRSALIVAVTIPFSLFFASILLDLRHIPANLLSLGALDFGMIVEGAAVMVENIQRRLEIRSTNRTASMDETIRAAAHEVQRPVFYAILIIILSYLPIFTLQRVEGRLFRPMAWTVAFALLGSLLFSILLAPVLASLHLPQGREGLGESRGSLDHQLLRTDAELDHGAAHGGAGRPAGDSRRIALPGGGRRDRLGVSAASGRRLDLGARNAGSQHRSHRGHSASWTRRA